MLVLNLARSDLGFGRPMNSGIDSTSGRASNMSHPGIIVAHAFPAPRLSHFTAIYLRNGSTNPSSLAELYNTDDTSCVVLRGSYDRLHRRSGKDRLVLEWETALCLWSFCILQTLRML